jgi:predicted nuclease of restriction endonuclease-like RecB superfamily
MDYTFEVVVILVRDGDELGLVRKVTSLYKTVVMELVKQWTQEYRDNGWQITRIYEQNYRFVNPDNLYEHD